VARGIEDDRIGETMAKTPDAAANAAGYQQHQGIPGASADAGVRTHFRVHAPRKHVPQEWRFEMDGTPPPASWLTVQLGGEAIRALVRHIEHEDLVIVELVNLPFSRNHTFRQHDFVPCERKRDGFGETWEARRNAIDRAELDRLAQERRQRAEAAERAKRGEKPKRERRKVT
jgi:hypothetical protein